MKKLLLMACLFITAAAHSQSKADTILIDAAKDLDSFYVGSVKYFKFKTPAAPVAVTKEPTVRICTATSDRITLADNHNTIIYKASPGVDIPVVVPSTLPIGFDVTLIQLGANSLKITAESPGVVYGRKTQLRSATTYSVVKLVVDEDKKAVIYLDTKY